MTGLLRPWDGDPLGYLDVTEAIIAAREPEVRAFTHLDLARARRDAEASAARLAAGKPLSEVDGMPFAVKEIIDVAGLPVELGSLLFAGRVPGADAAAVAALRRAGAIVIGVTTSTPFACGTTTGTRNPHRLAATPGGSSAGSGAAVGAGMVPLALGSQSQASTIRPASYCGAWGYKPTHGRIARTGMHQLSDTLDDVGVLAASLDDLRLAAGLLLGAAVTHAEAASGNQRAREPLRLGWLRLDDGGLPSAATRTALSDILARLSAAGAEVTGPDENRELAAFDAAVAGSGSAVFDVFAGESAAIMARYVPGEPDPRLLEMTGRARDIGPSGLARALDLRMRLRAAFAPLAARFDALIALSTTNPAPDGHASTGCRRMPATASFLGVPALSAPLLTVGGLPLGMQMLGAVHGDEQLFAAARRVLDHLEPQKTARQEAGHDSTR